MAGWPGPTGRVGRCEPAATAVGVGCVCVVRAMVTPWSRLIGPPSPPIADLQPMHVYNLYRFAINAGSCTMGPMSELGLRERKKQRTRQALRQAAIELFLRRGFEATTIADITAAADVAPRTFFAYFQSKEDVVLDEGAESFARAQRALQQRPQGEPLLAAFRRAALEIAAGMQTQSEQERSVASSAAAQPFRRGSATGWASGRSSSPR